MQLQLDGAPAIVAGHPFSLEQIIEIQREFRRTGQFAPLGRIDTITFWVLEGYTIPPANTDALGKSLEYFRQGPMIGISADAMHLIIRDPFPLKLQDVPNPLNQNERIPQRYQDRADSDLHNSRFTVFEPIRQVLADPISIQLPGAGPQAPPLVFDFREDSFGKHAALLIHKDTGEGFIAGGAYETHQ